MALVKQFWTTTGRFVPDTILPASSMNSLEDDAEYGLVDHSSLLSGFLGQPHINFAYPHSTSSDLDCLVNGVRIVAPAVWDATGQSGVCYFLLDDTGAEVVSPSELPGMLLVASATVSGSGITDITLYTDSDVTLNGNTWRIGKTDAAGNRYIWFCDSASGTEGKVGLRYNTADTTLEYTQDGGATWRRFATGTGDVVGPSSSTDGHIPLFDGTSGKLLKDGLAVVITITSASTDAESPTAKAVWDLLSGVPTMTDFAYSASSSTGLSYRYLDGTARYENNVFVVTGSDITLDDDTTNFVELDTTGAVVSNTVGFTAGNLPLAEAITAGGAITSVTDKRAWLNWDNGAGGGTPGGADGDVQYKDGTSFAGEAAMHWDATKHRLGLGTNTPRQRLELRNITDHGDAVVYLSASGLAHGITDAYPTDVAAAVNVTHATNGGLSLSGLTASTLAGLTLAAIQGSGGSGAPAISLQVSKKNGTGTQALADSDLALSLINGTASILRVLGNGALGIREGGSSPIYFTYLKGGDQAADITYTLPTALPATSGYALTCDTSGVLSWTAVSGTGDVIGDTVPVVDAEFAQYAGTTGKHLQSTGLSKTLSVTGASTDAQLPTAKAVYDALGAVSLPLATNGEWPFWYGTPGTWEVIAARYSITPARATSANYLQLTGDQSDAAMGTTYNWIFGYKQGTGRGWFTASDLVPGGGSPGGSDGDVQYKNGTAFAGDGNNHWDATDHTLTLKSDLAALKLQALTDATNIYASFVNPSGTPIGTLGFLGDLATLHLDAIAATSPTLSLDIASVCKARLTATGFGIPAGSGGVNTTHLVGSGSQAADVTYTLPTALPGTSGYVLSCDTSGVLSWAAAGGGSSPAGSNTQIQFNNSGAFGADSGFHFDTGTTSGVAWKRLVVGNPTIVTGETGSLYVQSFAAAGTGMCGGFDRANSTGIQSLFGFTTAGVGDAFMGTMAGETKVFTVCSDGGATYSAALRLHGVGSSNWGAMLGDFGTIYGKTPYYMLNVFGDGRFTGNIYLGGAGTSAAYNAGLRYSSSHLQYTEDGGSTWNNLGGGAASPLIEGATSYAIWRVTAGTTGNTRGYAAIDLAYTRSSPYSVASGDQSVLITGGEGQASGAQSMVLGGNNLKATGDEAVVIGGNNAIGSGTHSVTIGVHNHMNGAQGADAWALGGSALAQHDGSFVFDDNSDDSTGCYPSSSNYYQTTWKASGGFRIFTNTICTVGPEVTPGSGSWSSISDVNTKDFISPVDPAHILDGLAALPMSTWQYKGQTGVWHIGPMAQDLYDAFGLGESETTITTIDGIGLALAGIQGLYQQLTALKAQIAALTPAPPAATPAN